MTSDDWLRHSFNVQVTAEEVAAGAPRKVPAGFLEPLRDRVYSVHSQSLERLSDRGGLSPVEIFCHFDAALLDSRSHSVNFWRCLDKFRTNPGPAVEAAKLLCAKWLGGAVEGHMSGTSRQLVVP